MNQALGFIGWLLVAALPAAAQQAQPKPPVKPPDVHMIWMGGNDCPPCRAWRMTELPKLEQSPEFKAIRFTFVEKVISSTVPPSFFLPSEVRPYKDKLDVASASAVGSPQCAILVNGEVYDYFHNTRRASDIEAMLKAIRTGGKYPFKRCLQFEARSGSKCAVSRD